MYSNSEQPERDPSGELTQPIPASAEPYQTAAEICYVPTDDDWQIENDGERDFPEE